MCRQMLLAMFLLIAGVQAQDAQRSITIYNNDLALIREIRSLHLQQSGSYEIPDISDEIIVSSVLVNPLKKNNSFTIIEQNFDYDLASVHKILEKSLELPIEVESAGKRYTGVLMGYEGELIILKTAEGLQIIKWKDSGEINLKKLPENLIVRPTLTYKLNVHHKGNTPIELSYLTHGFKWEVSYVGNYNPRNQTMELNSWADIKNNTSVTFPESKLYLMAGDVNMASDAVKYKGLRRGRATLMQISPPEFKEQSVFEYHMYELNVKTDLKSKQEKQIAFLNPTTVKVKKVYRFDAQLSNTDVFTFLRFLNKKENGLGMAIPAGKFRIYQNVDGVKQFIGEDRIGHTPRNEKIHLKMGTAFDLKGERNVVESVKRGRREVEETIEVQLRNNKEKEKVEIKVYEHPSGAEWQILESNFPYKKKSIRSVIFTVPVEADSKATLKFKIRRKW